MARAAQALLAYNTACGWPAAGTVKVRRLVLLADASGSIPEQAQNIMYESPQPLKVDLMPEIVGVPVEIVERVWRIMFATASIAMLLVLAEIFFVKDHDEHVERVMDMKI